MRSGSSLAPMSEDRLRAIFAEGRPDWLEEPALGPVDSTVVVDLLDTQTFFELLKLPYPTDQTRVMDRLLQDRLIDRVEGGLSIRRLGALLLAKRLDAFPDLARKAARVIVYAGASKLEPKIDQTGQRGYAVGFQGLVAFIMGQLPQNEIIENALRRSVKLLPEDCVRELVANALIHQDLTIGGAAPMVEIYSNRIEISNPGLPIVPVERFIDGYQSRNERLAERRPARHGLLQPSQRRSRAVERLILQASREDKSFASIAAPTPDDFHSRGRQRDSMIYVGLVDVARYGPKGVIEIYVFRPHQSDFIPPLTEKHQQAKVVTGQFAKSRGFSPGFPKLGIS